MSDHADMLRDARREEEERLRLAGWTVAEIALDRAEREAIQGEPRLHDTFKWQCEECHAEAHLGPIQGARPRCPECGSMHFQPEGVPPVDLEALERALSGRGDK